MMPGKRFLLTLLSVLGLTGGGTALFLYIQHAPAFEITHVAIQGNVQLHPEDLVQHLNIPPHTNIFQIQLDEIQTRLESLQWVKTATVFRTIPHKLRVDITERTPFALVKLGQLHLVDSEGVILGELASGSAITLPIITGKLVESMRADDENPQVRPTFQALERLIQASPPVVADIRKIVIHSPDNVTIMSRDEAYPELRVSLRDDASNHRNIERLRQMLPTIDLQHAAYIDVRFDQRIIVMPTNKS